MKTLAISGWGQPHDALAAAFPDADHWRYSQHKSVDAALKNLAETMSDYDCVIGWSLGGQLAVQAIGAKLFSAKKLILLSTPFSFVKKNGEIGMPQDAYIKFRDNYAKNPKQTLSKAWELIAYGDEQSKQVKELLLAQNANDVLQEDWLFWLDALNDFNAEELALDHFPDSLLIYGSADAVVHAGQGDYYAKHLPGAKLASWQGCGHAPHLHDKEKLSELVREYIDV